MAERLESQVALQLAERLRSEATKQGKIPFVTGDLRKSIQTNLERAGVSSVGSVLPYAAAVHDGRKAVTLRPNVDKNPTRGERKKYHNKAWYAKNPDKARLRFIIGGRVIYAKEVHQPARKGQPFLTQAWGRVKTGGFGFLSPLLTRHFTQEVADRICKNITVNLM